MRMLTADTALMDLIVDEEKNPAFFRKMKAAIEAYHDPETGTRPYAQAFEQHAQKHPIKGGRTALTDILREALDEKGELGPYPLHALVTKCKTLGASVVTGGSASNTLSTVAETLEDGLLHVTQLCGLGVGPLSRDIRSSFSERNYRFAPPANENALCPFSIILNAKGKRRVFTHPGTVKETTTVEACKDELAASYDAILLSGSLIDKMPDIYHALLKKSEQVKELYVSLPTKLAITEKHTDAMCDLVGRADVVLSNIVELSWLAHAVDARYPVIDDEKESLPKEDIDAVLGWLQKRLQREGKPQATALITMSKHGAALIDDKGIHTFPVWQKDAPILSTTGGGDAGYAGYLAARLKGLGPQQAAQMAMAFAADCIRWEESRIPHPHEVFAQALDDPRLQGAYDAGYATAHGGAVAGLYEQRVAGRV